MSPTPHPLVEPLLALVGVWQGEGRGRLPGRDEFTWRETFEVGHSGTPALSFRQRTRRPDGSPFHAEDGWLRVPPELQTGDERRVELAVTSPTGVVEALAGTVVVDGDAVTVDASSTTVAGTPAAASVLRTRRRWALTGGTLTCSFWMATPTDSELFHHLSVEMTRADG